MSGCESGVTMAGRARSSGQATAEQEDTATKAEVRSGDGGELTKDVRPSQPAEGGGEGRRAATLNLPFVTAEFRAPDLHVPSRDELGAAARGARSMLPSRSAMLFYGGLAVTAVVGAIEWPVAAAIGVGSALASRGAANPQPGGDAPQTGGTQPESTQAEGTQTPGKQTAGVQTPGTARHAGGGSTNGDK
jgi:hypothetical protein